MAFTSAVEWVSRLSLARQLGRPRMELEKLHRIPLLVVDEVGYIPFDPEAASLFFSLVASRYERASTIVTSSKTFSPKANIAEVHSGIDYHTPADVHSGRAERVRELRSAVLLGATSSTRSGSFPKSPLHRHFRAPINQPVKEVAGSLN